MLLRQLQDANNSALQQLGELSTKNNELATAINQQVHENDLTFPGRPKISLSSSTSSTTESESISDSSEKSLRSYRSGTNVTQINLTLQCDYKKHTCPRKKT